MNSGGVPSEAPQKPIRIRQNSGNTRIMIDLCGLCKGNLIQYTWYGSLQLVFVSLHVRKLIANSDTAIDASWLPSTALVDARCWPCMIIQQGPDAHTVPWTLRIDDQDPDSTPDPQRLPIFQLILVVGEVNPY